MTTTPTLRDAAPRSLCTDCGVSRMADPAACSKACQFIKPDYPTLEARVHGQTAPDTGDARFFGGVCVTRDVPRAALTPAREGAQWTGLTTRLAEQLPESDKIDAVLTMVPDPTDRWRKQSAIITTRQTCLRHAACAWAVRLYWRCWNPLPPLATDALR
jgi:coenzyme F420 hydrogenase subunit beta